jgi:hypothetical protein
VMPVRYPRSNYRPSYRRSYGMMGGVAVIFVVLIFVVIGFTIWEHSQQKTVTFNVRDKITKTHCDGNNSCNTDYLIFTDKGVYKDTDSFWFFKFNSSDVYGELQRGHYYTCKTYGFRVRFTSSYPNILSCKEGR